MDELPWTPDPTQPGFGVTINFSSKARSELQSLGRFTRALVERAVETELLSPSAEAEIRKITDLDQGSLLELPVGNFRVLFESHKTHEGVHEQLIARVVREGQEEQEALTELGAERVSSAPASAGEDDKKPGPPPG